MRSSGTGERVPQGTTRYSPLWRPDGVWRGPGHTGTLRYGRRDGHDRLPAKRGPRARRSPVEIPCRLEQAGHTAATAATAMLPRSAVGPRGRRGARRPLPSPRERPPLPALSGCSAKLGAGWAFPVLSSRLTQAEGERQLFTLATGSKPVTVGDYPLISSINSSTHRPQQLELRHKFSIEDGS